MALNSGKILMRRGQEVNFDPSKMTPGEWAVSLDSKYVRMCFSPGVCVRMATYDAFEADMEQMKNILQECKSIEEFVERVYNEIKNIVIDVERIELASANALKSEQNALKSETNAKVSETVASDKAAEAILSAETAVNKASEAANSSIIATQKSNKASEYANTASEAAIISQSYATGGTGTRDGEDTDNAKFYNEQSRSNAERAEDAAGRAVAIAGVDIATVELAGLVRPDGDSIKLLPDGTIYSNTPEIERKLEETNEKVNVIIQKAELNIKDIASGDKIHLTDSADGKIVDFALYGKALQNGTPTPQNPVDIEVSGSDGDVIISTCGKNFLNQPDISIDGWGFWIQGDIPTNTGAGAKKIYLPKDTYTISFKSNISKSNAIAIDFFDKNVQDILNITSAIAVGNNEFVFELEKDAYAIRAYTNATVQFSDIQIEKGNKKSDYESYKESFANISITNGFAGIKVNSDGNYTDENGQQRICDEIVKYADGTGKRIKRINKVIADGVNLAFSERYTTDNNVVYSIDTNAIPAIKREHSNESVPLMSSHFITTNYDNIVNNDIMGITKVGGYTRLICGFGKNSELSSLELANSWLRSNNVTIYYQLETPVETPLTSEEIAEIEKLHTLYPVTNISNDADCGMKVKYIADSKNYIDNKLALQAKAREEEMMAMLLLLPEETQAKMIENDTNNLLTESEK